MNLNTRITSILLLLPCWLLQSLPAQEIDPIFHNNVEIIATLRALEDDYPDWVLVDSVGHSSRYNLPIWMATLTDNPGEPEPEPTLLFVGQVHAEELAGVELTLELMHLLLDGLEDEANRARLEGLRLQFIPTANPEGLEVVHAGFDETFRKNCRDNVGDGVLRFQNGSGHDTSGVDLNRNFGLHWERGDTLYSRNEANFLYNYYRGPAPFSEPECRALKDLALAWRPSFSITYHQSRSGQNAELVIGPWTWEGKHPPEDPAISELGWTLADTMNAQDQDNFYNFARGSMRVGQEQDWFYQRVGTFKYLVEIGNGISNDSTTLRSLLDEQIPAAFFLMDLALGVHSIQGFGNLGVIVTDARTDSPLAARLDLNGATPPVLKPRMTSALTGRFDWLLPAEECSLLVSCSGYRSEYVRQISITENHPQLLEIDLLPLPAVTLSLHLTRASDDSALAASLRLEDNFGTVDWINLPPEGAEIQLHQARYSLQALSEGFLPILVELELDRDTSLTLHTQPAQLVWDEDFDRDADWERGGAGVNWGVSRLDNRTVLSDSPDQPYASNSGSWVALDTEVGLNPDYDAVLELIHHAYFEPGVDSARLEIYNWGAQAWDRLAEFSTFPDGWDTLRLSLDNRPPGQVWLRMMVLSDGSLEEEGWDIDRIRLWRSDRLQEAVDPSLLPEGFAFSAHPNPFNARLSISLSIPANETGSLALFDLSGRMVQVIPDRLHPGSNLLSLDASHLPGGMYVLRYTSQTREESLKITLQP